jgi:glucosamine kinase
MLYLGLDGGGSGCRAAICDAQGHVLGRAEAGPANIGLDPDAAFDNILRACQAALSMSGASGASVCATLGLAGANVPGMADRLRPRLPFKRVQIVSDAETATRGALGTQDGIAVAIGTGSVLAVQRGAEIRPYGGRGFLLGDEGSGAVLGRTLLAEALRADDGFSAMTPLLRATLDLHGGGAGIIAFALEARPADFARLAPQVVSGDDPAARSIFTDACTTLGRMIEHLQGSTPLPVVFLGGLGPAYAKALAGRWDIRPALGSGLDGAMHMARDQASVALQQGRARA